MRTDVLMALVLLGLAGAIVAAVAGRRRSSETAEERAQAGFVRHNVVVEEAGEVSPAELFALAAAEVDCGTVYQTVSIPAPIEPMDRWALFEQPLEAALGELGEVTGGGTIYGEQDGSQVVVAVEIHIELSDVQAALPVVVAALRRQGVPAGTRVLDSEGEPLHTVE